MKDWNCRLDSGYMVWVTGDVKGDWLHCIASYLFYLFFSSSERTPVDRVATHSIKLPCRSLNIVGLERWTPVHFLGTFNVPTCTLYMSRCWDLPDTERLETGPPTLDCFSKSANIDYTASGVDSEYRYSCRLIYTVSYKGYMRRWPHVWLLPWR